MKLADIRAHCGQCGFNYSRIDTEVWGHFSSRRVMCPICGWTVYEEYRWNEDGNSSLMKRSESQGFGAYRLIPPGGYTGYNAFHSEPDPEVLDNIKELLTAKGWKGYLSLWNSKEKKAFLVTGHPLNKFDLRNMNGTR